MLIIVGFKNHDLFVLLFGIQIIDNYQQEFDMNQINHNCRSSLDYSYIQFFWNPFLFTVVDFPVPQFQPNFQYKWINLSQANSPSLRQSNAVQSEQGNDKFEQMDKRFKIEHNQENLNGNKLLLANKTNENNPIQIQDLQNSDGVQEKQPKKNEITCSQVLVQKISTLLPRNQHAQQQELHQQLKALLIQILKGQKQNQKLFTHAIFKKYRWLLKIVKAFEQRVRNFKKSKEEMLKIIIRRIQKYHLVNVCKNKNKKFMLYGGYKSMNISYLNQLFSDEQFVESYTKVIKKFKNQFRQQNYQKIEDFVHKVKSIESKEQMLETLKYLDQKGRMPWPQRWVHKIGKVADQIQDRYVNKNNKI